MIAVDHDRRRVIDETVAFDAIGRCPAVVAVQAGYRHERGMPLIRLTLSSGHTP